MTMTDRVAAYLIAREGHRIDNRQRRVGSRVVSEYRYCAPRAVYQEELPL